MEIIRLHRYVVKCGAAMCISVVRDGCWLTGLRFLSARAHGFLIACAQCALVKGYPALAEKIHCHK